MSSPAFATAQARTSCQRCHKRKKRCDRTLPQCENCRLVHVACSFLDDDRQVGSYPIAFVRGLEDKVRGLETQLASVSGMTRNMATASSYRAQSHGSSSSTHKNNINSNINDMDTANHAEPQPLELTIGPQNNIEPPLFLAAGVGPVDNLAPDFVSSPEHTPARSLVDELKLLSLEATAERYLGFTSGLSFARLTQMILQRLSPDKAEFVFANNQEQEAPGDQQQPIIIPDALNSMIHGFHHQMTVYPTLFGDFSLSDITDSPDVLGALRFPEEAHVQRLVEFYFAHSHSLYPILNRTEFNSALQQIYLNPQDPLAQSSLWLFRIWIVLAIGSTTYCSVSLSEESEPMLYYNKAMQYFENALGYGDVAVLEVIMLQVSYSFFNQLGPNTWFLVGLAARMAVGMGLHTSSTYDSMPADLVERRKRIFFSIYMMDRVVSMALGRPFALHDDDIDTTPFADADDANITPEGILPQTSLEPSSMAIPLHILSLRRIASKIAKNVYSKTLKPTNREDIIRDLHKELIDWRRNMPFPLPDLHPNVPHSGSNWYDLNFYAHLAMLYRPSPLFPTLDQARVKILAEAAAMSIRLASNMHHQRRFAYNWLNLLSVYTAALSLIYAVTAQPDSLISVLRETRAIDDLELVLELFDTLSFKFKAVKNIRNMIQEIVSRYKELSSALIT